MFSIPDEPDDVSHDVNYRIFRFTTDARPDGRDQIVTNVKCIQDAFTGHVRRSGNASVKKVGEDCFAIRT